jgi:F-type H+-transporting ATPase subunit delta
VTSRGAAGRYARALFDITLGEGRDVAVASEELNAFARLFSTNTALARVLTNPAIPASRKRAVVEQVIAKAGTLPAALAKLLLLLAERDRLALIPDVAAAFENRLLDHQNVVRAELVTAIDLPPDRTAALEQNLAAATGRSVVLTTRVDPDIIGGAVARIGGTVYDGSVTRQLARIRDSLINTRAS